MIGLYVHIPFCQNKCDYCDFYSIQADDSIKSKYTEAVCQEMEQVPNRNVADTLYFGGGTPTLMKPEQIGAIIQKASYLFGLNDAEITVEANPNTVDSDMLNTLREYGCNRISFGMQSAVQKELKALGRTHTPYQVVRAVEFAKLAGFDNISIDIMLDIPYQTQKSLDKTLDFVDKLGVKHVSAYLLTIEPETPLYHSDYAKHSIDDDKSASLYLHAATRLEEMGFNQYEISNFSRSGYESRHNLKYWLCQPYYGFGCAAHSFNGEMRYGHSRDIDKYLKYMLDDQPYTDTEAGGWDEALMLGLRLNRGINLTEAQRNYDFDKDLLLEKISEYSSSGLMEISDNTIKLTTNGFLVSNEILANLIDF